MIRSRVHRLAVALVFSALMVFLPCSSAFRGQPQAEGLPPGDTVAKPRDSKPAATVAPHVVAADEGTKKQKELLERETAVSLKEQELKRLSDILEARILQLQEARKEIEASLERKKKEDAEKFKKMLKIYKSLRPEEAAALIDKLDESMALEMLNRMDAKTAVKIVPLMNQDRVLKWTRLSLKEK